MITWYQKAAETEEEEAREVDENFVNWFINCTNAGKYLEYIQMLSASLMIPA